MFRIFDYITMSLPIPTSLPIGSQRKEKKKKKKIWIPSSFYLPIHECIFQQWCDSVDVVFAHLSNVLEQKREGLEYTVLYVKFRNTVFIHECRQNGKW